MTPGKMQTITVGMILLLCALVGVGCASGASATPTATAMITATVPPLPTLTPALSPTSIPATGTPNGFSTFRNSDGTYAIDFPSTWGTQPSTAHGVTAQLFGTTDQSAVFAVLPITQAVLPANYSTIIDGFAGSGGLGSTDVRIFPVATTSTINTTTWARLTATFTLGGVPNSLLAYVASHGTGTFALLMYAPDAGFAQIYTAAFTPMAQSFTFLK